MNTESLCRFLRLPTFAGRRAKLEPETERQLQELATSLGRAPEELAKGARSAYLTELAEVRATSDLRCDVLKSGKVEAVDGTAALIASAKQFRKQFWDWFHSLRLATMARI